jgi:fused signal recognition particle receptor
VLAAIARWCTQHGRVIPVYFVGVGETMQDIQTFSAREFSRALLEM